MTDVRLTASTTDGEVVPLLANTKGELLLEEPIAPPEFDGNLDGDLTVSGLANFAQNIDVGTPNSATTGGSRVSHVGQIVTNSEDGTYKTFISKLLNQEKIFFLGSGSAEFTGEVTIGSRSKKWLIRESNGVAMLIDQGSSRGPEKVRGSEKVFEKVRDLPHELDLIEAALSEIMEKLKMTPPAGWEVWDGSDNSQ